MGLGPTSAAVGICEPVTMTRSASAAAAPVVATFSGGGLVETVCASATEDGGQSQIPRTKKRARDRIRRCGKAYKKQIEGPNPTRFFCHIGQQNGNNKICN